MTDDGILETWERKLYTPGGGDAVLSYFIFGTFDQDLEISSEKYRTNGLPAEMTISLYTRDEHQEVFDRVLDSYSTKRKEESDPQLFSSITGAPSCLRLVGEFKDPKSLNYLRDSSGVIAAILDQGGVALFDSIANTWWSKDDWKETFFNLGKSNLHRQIEVMISETDEQPDIQDWMHTRGMIKFGRPDLSMHLVPEHLIEAVAFLFSCLTEDQALGVQILEGQNIDMGGLPAGITCHHAGGIDDLDFNNVHLELHFPRHKSSSIVSE